MSLLLIFAYYSLQNLNTFTGFLILLFFIDMLSPLNLIANFSIDLRICYKKYFFIRGRWMWIFLF